MAEDMTRGREGGDGEDAEAFAFEMCTYVALGLFSVEMRIFPETCEESLRGPFSYGDAAAAG